MKFITLTNTRGQRLRVNFETVRFYCDREEDENTVIYYHSSLEGDFEIVTESPEEIDEMLRAFPKDFPIKSDFTPSKRQYKPISPTPPKPRMGL